MRRNNSAEHPVSSDKKNQHNYEHEGALERVRVHDRLKPTRQYVHRYQERTSDQCGIIVYTQINFQETGQSNQHRSGVNGQENEDNQTGEPLQER